MRILLSLPLVLAFTVTASAQSNQTTVTQAGGATATVTQSGSGPGGGANTAIVDQNGVSTASVTQSGDLNLADVAQSGAGNDATLQQTGDENEGLIYQGRSGTTIPLPYGTASGNSARLEQSGNRNRGLEQNILSPLDAGIVYQGVRGGTASGNTTAVYQRGDEGQAWATQGDFGATATGNTATIDQSGVENDASTIQGYYAPIGLIQAAGSTATITQTAGSANNDSYIFQGVNGTSASDQASITQTGRFDLATVSQGSYAVLGSPTAYVGRSSGNMATVTQGGVGTADYANTVTVLQGVNEGVNDGEAINNDATVAQADGTIGNRASVYQGLETLSTDSFAFVYQNSDGNTATVQQSGTANTATTTQN
ncbi:MAG TPA: hypothetical protein VF594_09845 [Rubricoccaceae bacterium]|jgi:hypothetical protein